MDTLSATLAEDNWNDWASKTSRLHLANMNKMTLRKLGHVSSHPFVSLIALLLCFAGKTGHLVTQPCESLKLPSIGVHLHAQLTTDRPMPGLRRPISMPVNSYAVRSGTVTAGEKYYRGRPSKDKFLKQIADASKKGDVELFNWIMSKSTNYGFLNQTQLAFDAMRKISVQPNEKSYNMLINACRRAGELERFEDVLAAMRRDNVPINEVTFTTVIKGYADALDMPRAWKYFDQLLATDGISPDIRTINALLQGCLYVGDNHTGPYRLMAYVNEHDIQVDKVTQNVLMNLASLSYDAKRLRDALRTHVPNGVEGLSPATQLNLCIAYALTNHSMSASNLLKLVEQTAVRSKFKDTKAAKKKGQILSRDEFAYALNTGTLCVREFLANLEHTDVVCHFSNHAVRRFPPMHDALRPVFDEAPTKASPWLVWHSATAAASADVMPSSATPLFSMPRPVKLEVGAGIGDWVVAQAEADCDYNWAAIELRLDRACLIHAKGVMRGLSNLAVLAGDAHGILKKSIPTQSVAEVVVNFPQPPLTDQTERHLVNSLFLAEAWRIMQPGGALIVTSDSERYIASIAHRISHNATLQACWRPFFAAPFYRTYNASGLGDNDGKVDTSFFDYVFALRGYSERYQLRYVASHVT